MKDGYHVNCIVSWDFLLDKGRMAENLQTECLCYISICCAIISECNQWDFINSFPFREVAGRGEVGEQSLLMWHLLQSVRLETRLVSKIVNCATVLWHSFLSVHFSTSQLSLHILKFLSLCTIVVNRYIKKFLSLMKYCKCGNFRVAVFFALLSSSRKLPPCENKTHMPLWK